MTPPPAHKNQFITSLFYIQDYNHMSFRKKYRYMFLISRIVECIHQYYITHYIVEEYLSYSLVYVNNVFGLATVQGDMISVSKKCVLSLNS